MDTIKKCLIARYDTTITEPPFLTIPIDSIEVVEPDTDDLGVEFAARLRGGCRMKGYKMKFYTMTYNKEYDYEIVVE